MSKRNILIENQYELSGLFEDILKRLKEQGIDLSTVSRSNIAGVDEFHIRGAEVSKELVAEFDLRDLKVLDVGCGLGGPCRMLADEFNCQVFGIDISHEFIRTAQKLSKLLSLDGKIEFVRGDALNLPFEDGSFNVVWTQHVQMNIENKLKFYSEINRVLDKNGVFIYYDIFKKDNEDVNYPVPWANNESVSFLQTIANMESILKDLGFTRKQVTDQTFKGIEFFRNLLDKIKISGPPKIGLNVLLGNSTKEKLGNVLSGLAENKIELQSGVYMK
jgi:ubiquinone/menaquinone biosynthesis C-methylase UbiE